MEINKLCEKLDSTQMPWTKRPAMNSHIHIFDNYKVAIKNQNETQLLSKKYFDYFRINEKVKKFVGITSHRT